jgi:DNA-binding transcriptional MerR regulator
MAVDCSSEPECDADSPALAGEHVVLAGRLFGANRRDAAALISAHGGKLVEAHDPSATLVVIGDGEADVASALSDVGVAGESLRRAVAAGRVQVLRESQAWQRLGLVDDGHVRRLYTPAMLAELVGVPASAIRRWHAQGALHAVRSVHRLPYFDFQEVAVARRLAELLQAGCSLRTIDRRLAELKRLVPDMERPLADPGVVVRGRRLFLRRGDELAEPGGQLLLDFDAPSADADDGPTRTVVSLFAARQVATEAPADGLVGGEETVLAERLQQQAIDFEDEGCLDRAAEAYRTLLMLEGPRPEIHFMLADLLYRAGDLSAARERYYAALELDEEYVEARVSLGCVLAEMGELELAAASFEGALVHHADFADAHFHLGNALERLQKTDEAMVHFRAFLELAPESPWAAAARDRLAESVAPGLDQP